MLKSLTYHSTYDIIQYKLEKISYGKQPSVLDLFSGCGGMTLGFELAGCKSLGGVELDPLAAQSYAQNFHSINDDRISAPHAVARDITAIGPMQLLKDFGVDNAVNEVDILIGGPPCPAFARVGRAKLREVNEHPEAFKHDPRAQLYVPYLEYVKQLRPLAILMENVPDILNFGGHSLGDEICEVLEEYGYICSYTLLNAASYGVPQMRERFFLVGIHSEVNCNFEFPIPTRLVNFPQGYHSSRQVALKYVLQSGLLSKSHYVHTPVPPSQAQPPVSAQEAINDLPIITGHLDGSIRRGPRRFDQALTYRSDIELSGYAKRMRSWPGFEGNGHIYDHVIRSLSNRDYRLFKAMSAGDDYPKAYALAETLFAQEIEKLANSGKPIIPGSLEYEKLKVEFIPPYDPGKFPNKWRKVEPDKPTRTLMAHLGKDTYSHIHYDSNQARTISVREAARLQSFPDGFRFIGTMNPAFRQIGNAVPPLMSFAIATQILKALLINA